MHRSRSLVLAALACLATTGAAALIPYQGLATNDRGIPLADSSSAAVLSLCEGATGETPLWRETRTVSVRKGLFSVLLGEVALPDSLLRRANLHLGVAIGPGQESRPRLRLGTKRLADSAEVASVKTEVAKKADTTVVAAMKAEQVKDSARIDILRDRAAGGLLAHRHSQGRADHRFPATGRLRHRSRGDGSGSLESACDDDASLAVGILLRGPGRVEVHLLDNLGTPVMDQQRRIDAQAFAKLAREDSNRAVVPLSWNLRSREGRAVASGVYLWRIRVVTDPGEEFETIRRLGVRDPR